MKRAVKFLRFFIPAILLALPAWAQPVQREHVEAELVSETASMQPGKPFWVALRLKMEEGWHTYWKDPGDSGMPTKISWDLPEGFHAGPIFWPDAERFELPPLVNYGYEGEVLLLTEITPPKNFPLSKKATLRAKAEWLVCKEICIPGEAELSLALPVKAEPPQWNEKWKPKFDEARKTIPEFRALESDAEKKQELSKAKSEKEEKIGNFWLFILFGFIGGLILNLMPCVFPVLSIKILGFVQQAGEDKAKIRAHGWIFAAGVMVSFWILAGILLALRAGGEELGWGFQLQSPRFVSLMALLFFGLSLSLLGVFEIGTSLISLGGKAKGGGWTDSFLSGVLATAVATPCTAPFMGAALGFALTQSAATSMAVFTALGAGLAAPYVVLSSSPGLLRFVPRPGEWMESFKQAMAFPLLAAVAWLVWVLGWQAGNNGVLALLVALLLLAMAGWIYGRWATPHRRTQTRTVAWIIAAVLLAVSLLTAWKIEKSEAILAPKQAETAGNVAWQKFSPELVEKLRAEGAPVFIDFTAAWCVTCQVNKKVALYSPKVQEKFQKLGVATVKADWTNRDPIITRALESFGRSGVPLYVLYAPGADKPRLLPELLTPEIVLEALNEME